MDRDWFFWKHYIVQTVVGLGLSFGTYYLTIGWLPALIHQGVCNFIVGPC